MAEKMPEGKEQSAENPEALQKELQSLLESFQKEPSPEGKMKALQRIFEILEKFKAMMPADQYAKSFGELEGQLQQAAGQLEG